MASSINASITNTGLVQTADASGILELQSNGVTGLTIATGGKVILPSLALGTATAGELEYDGSVPYFTPQGTQRGLVPSAQYFRLNSPLAGSNATGAQSIFGVGVTLSANTVYHFEAVYSFNKSAGTTAHTFGISFGGTAVLNNIAYQTIVMDSSVSYVASIDASQTIQWIQSTANQTIVASSTAATLFNTSRLTGTLSVSSDGTFVPQYTLSAAPGGAYTTAAGSYFLIYPVGVAGSNTSIGTWA